MNKTERADLHIHTRYSKDGFLTPDEIHVIAKKKRIKVLSFTDHESTDAIKKWFADHKISYKLPFADIDGIRYIPGVELVATCPGFTDVKGKPFKIHLLVYGGSLESTSPLEKLVTIKNYNDNLITYSVLYHVAKRLNVKNPSETYIKDYIKDARKDNPHFSKFDLSSSIDFIKKYDFCPGRSEREITKLLRNVPIPRRIEVSVEDMIKIAHASGGICEMAHPTNTLSRLNPAHKPVDLINYLLDNYIDGFETIHNGLDPEINKMITYCINERLNINEYTKTGGSDDHFDCDIIKMGSLLNGRAISVDDNMSLIKQLEIKKYVMLNNLSSNRAYPTILAKDINEILARIKEDSVNAKQEYTDAERKILTEEKEAIKEEKTNIDK